MIAVDDIIAAWRACWPDALAAWSSWTQLREPRFLDSAKAAGGGMAGQIAAIRLADNIVLVNAKVVLARGLAAFGPQILAHEVGHHVYVPGNRADHARLLAVMLRVLEGMPREVLHTTANLWADLLVNDRLQRRVGLDMAAVYRVLCAPGPGEVGWAWRLYCRAMEHLWRLPRATLDHPRCDTTTEQEETLDGDALLVAELVRAFAADWIPGGRRFAAVLAPYLARDLERKRPDSLRAAGLADTRGALAGGPAPDGLTGIDPAEDDDGPLLPGLGGDGAGAAVRRGQGQARRPDAYAELLKVLGVPPGRGSAMAHYYRERALPHLVPFPRQRAPRATEPVMEGLDLWEVGDDLRELDIFSSVTLSPQPIPGITTVQRSYGEHPGAEPARVPADLDIYVDCSGSMPNPAQDLSHLTLAATILSLSALRAGAAVQATLWSSPGRVKGTKGFLRDEAAVLAVVTDFVSGSTSFPLHRLEETYRDRPASAPPVHLVVISDEGVDTLLDTSASGTPGEEVCRVALDHARGGGTLVLNMTRAYLERWAAHEPLIALGFCLHLVQDWADLLAFARAFARSAWGEIPPREASP